MGYPTVYPLLAALLLAAPTTLLGQAGAATNQCADSISKSMAFLTGKWEGQSYSVAGRDTTPDAMMLIESEPLFGGCAVEERWRAVQDNQTLFTARVLRGYDAPSRRWLVYYVDDQLNSQFYEGKYEDGRWRFHRTRMDRGTPSQVRLTWSRAGAGYQQSIDRSRDGGKTWSLGGFVTFKPSHQGRD